MKKKKAYFVTVSLLWLVIFGFCGVPGRTAAARKHVHRFSAWQTTKPASCRQSGLQTRECKNCGYSESRSLPKGDHEFDE